MNLLQITIAQSNSLQETNETMTAFTLLLKGGWVMLPIFFLSVAGMYLIIEKLIALKKANKTPKQWMDKIKERIRVGDTVEVKLLCQQENTPIARIIEQGIEKMSDSREYIEASLENVGKMEAYKLEKNLSLLGTISGAAPMLGFLGTVIGMIQAFIVMAQKHDNVNLQLLSSGIYQAMITTAAGLVVGIIAYLGYNYILAQIQKIIHNMEYTAGKFIELLHESPKIQETNKISEYKV
ncbi:MAG: MotA/TolQ/ExbB proton channel family protein [Cytophagales bacterium]|nr:MotA/TolQ/ExbB proton channel family protein [Cytophagales bacterium]